MILCKLERLNLLESVNGDHDDPFRNFAHPTV